MYIHKFYIIIYTPVEEIADDGVLRLLRTLNCVVR